MKLLLIITVLLAAVTGIAQDPHQTPLELCDVALRECIQHVEDANLLIKTTQDEAEMYKGQRDEALKAAEAPRPVYSLIWPILGGVLAGFVLRGALK